MKKLQVMIEDSMMKDLKQHALDHETTLKDIISEAVSLYLSNTNTTRIIESNDTLIQESKEEEQKPKQPYSSGVDWDNIKIQDGPNDDDMFDWVTDLDEDGNPVLDENGKEKKIRLIKAEHLYGKIEEPENKPYDLNDPIDKMLYEQEQAWKKEYGE
jgi:hypothetical protein